MSRLVVASYKEPSRARRRQLQITAERLGAEYLNFTSGYDLFMQKALLGEHTVWVPLEVTARAIPLREYEHPERALYLVGPQNGTIPSDVLSRLSHPVVVETATDSPTQVLPTPVVVGVVLHHRLTQKEGVVANDGNHHRVHDL